MKPKRIKPGPGQESVWDYPRPPRMEAVSKHIQVIYAGILLADSHHAWRVLETSHPPVYYIPPADIEMEYLAPASGASFCEWKGRAAYYTVVVQDQHTEKAAWYYPEPSEPFAALKNHIAFYPGWMEACYVDGELVRPQPGNFYGGWITKDIVGPFKGELGSMGW